VCTPNGGNMQRWRFLVIRDPKVKETIGALYKRAWGEQVAPRIDRVNRHRAPAGSGLRECLGSLPSAIPRDNAAPLAPKPPA
jgi:nitroreductase